jgi:hypothetical protein
MSKGGSVSLVFISSLNRLFFMLNQRHWIIILVLIFLCVSLFYVSLRMNLISFSSVTENKISDKKAENLSAIDKQSAASLLSRDAEYPSPVIQLQQTVADGFIKDSENDLPLLQGELSEFSHKNIHKKYPQPEELTELKQRLQQLQAVSHSAQ